MEELICPKCGSTTDYYTELKSNQNVARCNNCDSFIKNIPYQKPQLYVGKYKGMPIDEIEDMSYLRWALDKMKLSAAIRKAIETRISSFEHLAK